MDKNTVVIAIDHGWSNMKTVHETFTSGIREITTEPALFENVLEKDGKYYKVGSERLKVKDSKVEDENYYLLSLAATAKELDRLGKRTANVYWAVGLPLVLDFVNSAEDIKASFEPFYEETVLLEETDPNVVYDMKNTLDDFRVYQKSEVDKFADIFYQSENQSAGDLGKLQGQLRPAVDRYEVLEVEKQDIFKSTLASFNRIYAYITQVCRLFDKDIHRFSIYSKFLYTMLPKGHGGENINIDDKVLLEYYKLEKDFEGPIELESTEGGYTPISGDSGHREPKKDPLTVIIDKINEKYGTHFTEMDKVLVQMENDYANQEKWQSYAKNNDRATFMLLFEKDFPNMAADRYEQNDQFFRKLFDDPDMMKQVMETVGSVLYERLKKKYVFDPKSGVVEEATPETYVEDTYLTKA